MGTRKDPIPTESPDVGRADATDLRSRRRPSPRVAVAIPVYNEEDVIEELLRRLFSVLDGLPGGPHQVVIVDDGSVDASRDILRRAADVEPRLKLVMLSRNFGHQAALTAALDHVEGDVCVLMDADLQDRPEAIPLFLERWSDGADVVYARRRTRRESAWLRFSYWAYYRILAGMAGIRLPVDAGDFSLLSRRVITELRGAPERHRYLRGLRAWAGFRQDGVDLDRDARHAGQSKYTMSRLLKLAFDGIFSFSVAPLRVASLLGAVTTLLTGAYATYALFVRLFTGATPQGFTGLILTIAFVSGVQLLFLGIVGEYVGRVYEEVKRRPLYVVERVVGGERGH